MKRAVLIFALYTTTGCINSMVSSHKSAGVADSASVSSLGKSLYSQNCAACHGELSLSSKRGRGLEQIKGAIQSEPAMSHLERLTSTEIGAIFAALNPVTDANCNPNKAAFVNIQRLTNREYNNVMRDLTGIDFKPALNFPEDPSPGFFDNNAQAMGVDTLRAQMHYDAALNVLDRTFANSDWRAKVIRCSNVTLAQTTLAATDPSTRYDRQGRGGVLDPGQERMEISGFMIFNIGAGRINYNARTLEVRVYGQTALDGIAPQFRVYVNGSQIGSGEAPNRNVRTFSFPINIAAGTAATVEVEFVNDFYQSETNNRDLYVQSISLNGNSASTGDLRLCAAQVINGFGLKAWRRPLTNVEQNQILTIYDRNFAAGPSINDFDESLKFALMGILISPQFYYKIFDNPGTDRERDLTGYELAARLAFLIWGSIPDEVLFQLAASGTLKDNLEAQIERMLKDPKADFLVEAFGERWLGLQKLSKISPDTSAFPTFNENLRQDLKTESHLVLADILTRGGSLRDVVAARYTYLNNSLAQHYGLPAPSSSQFTKVALPAIRQGLLTHGSVLAINSAPSESSIVHRGLWVMNRMLCASVGPAPANAQADGPPPPPNASPRERQAAHTTNRVCASCHVQIDNYGFGLENFDGIGRWRSAYSNGSPVDAHGTIANNGKYYANSPQFLAAIAEDSAYPSCASQNFINYALGRKLTAEDQCAVQKTANDNVRTGSSFADLIKQVVRLDQFQKHKGEK